MKLSNDSLIRMDQRHAIGAGIVTAAGIPLSILSVYAAYHGWHWAYTSFLWPIALCMVIFGPWNLYTAVRDYRRDSREFGQ